MALPAMTIVTPSFNQGRFLEETMISVVGQGYPDLEYIVMDGGSTDETVSLLERYTSRIDHWQSAPDEGQPAAINAGFRRSRGQILGWLNSDDHYLAGALLHAARLLDPSKPQILVGNGARIRDGSGEAWGSDVMADHQRHDLLLCDYVQQPSAFWTRAAWDLVGELDESLHYAFDWDWFIRAKVAGVEYRFDHKYLSVYRLHEAHKTGTGGAKRNQEIASLYRRHKSEAHARAFEEMIRREPQVRRAKSWVMRQRLRFAAPRVFRAMMPRVLSPLSDQDIVDLAMMV